MLASISRLRVGLLVGLLACTPAGPSSSASPDAPASPAPGGPRVVSLHDTTTEIVVGLGRADALVAVAEPAFLSPDAVVAVATVPRLPAGPVSAEAILVARPTLVLGTDVVVERQPELPTQLGDVPARFIDPAHLADLWAEIASVASLLSVDPAPYLSSLQGRLPPPAAPDGPPIRVALYDCCDPPFVAAGRGPLDEILARLGAVNVFAPLDQDWTHVSWEALVAARPDLVVIHDYTWDGQAGVADKRAALLAHGIDAPTVVLPLALALEGPRVVEAAAVLGPAIRAVASPAATP